MSEVGTGEPGGAPANEPSADAEDTTPSRLQVPVLVTDELIVFPSMMAPLMVVRRRDMAAIDEALLRSRLVLSVARKPGAGDSQSPGEDDVYGFGTVTRVLKKMSVPDGTLRVLLQGVDRARVIRWLQTEPVAVADIEVKAQEPDPEGDREFAALVLHLRSQFQRVVELSGIPEEAYVTALNVDSGGRLCDVIAANIDIPVGARQAILEAVTPKDRVRKILNLLSGELEVLELREKIRNEARTEMERAQRQFYLRQQLDAIRRELGEVDEHEQESDEIEAAIVAADMPEEAREQAERELARLRRMNPASAEYSVSRTYLDWLIRFPWAKATKDDIELGEARRVLDEDHYDLEKVKERILEFLAVLTLNPGQKGSILCFVGPPGTGKTSLGMSIARALGRKFARMSLGGMRDEAEIRGHRRTYVGALPGRIVQGLCQASSINPVFMLDEVDKIGMDFRGDPASALLEVLDPAQNKAFRDLYLDVDVDLSRVIFITTANALDTVPMPLRDRMEVLPLSGYTLREKLEIGRRHLVPRQTADHGLPKGSLRFRKDGLSAIVTGYTREAGVRNFEREIASICRKRARRLVEGDHEPLVVTREKVAELLGPPRFFEDTVTRHAVAGVVAGLAWTPTGGDVLFVETSLIRGGKGLTLTGSLGEVMKESAQAALTCVRTRAASLGVDPSIFADSEVHIHVPAGAIPKDGPSAGVTMAVALASLLTGRPARDRLAMTGEITLQGRVLRIGGVKEKVLTAARVGVRTVILPRDNEVDLVEVPDEVKRRLRIVLVETVEEAIEEALRPARAQASVPSR